MIKVFIKAVLFFNYVLKAFAIRVVITYLF